MRTRVLQLCWSLLRPAAALAQQDAATLTGIVKDADGAIVPGETVSLVNVQTSISVETITNTDGFYTMAGLRPGQYSMTVELPSFAKVERPAVTLRVAQVARIDVTLEPGRVSEKVTVVAPTPLLDRETSSRGLVVGETTILEIPLNGRDSTGLTTIVPGVLSGTPRLGSVNFKNAGVRPRLRRGDQRVLPDR
jgi:hypothetical protein